MLSRLATMVLAGSALPYDAVIRQIEMGVDILIHITRTSDGKRRIDEICRVGPLRDNDFTVIPIFTYEEGEGLVPKTEYIRNETSIL